MYFGQLGNAFSQANRNAIQQRTAGAPVASSSSGQRFEPWQQDASQQLLGKYMGVLDQIGGAVGNVGGPTGAGADFQGYFQNVGGPGSNFTDVPISGVWTPQMLNQGVNALWADNDARTANQALQTRQQLGPGMAGNSPALQEMLANNAGRMQAVGSQGEQQFRQNAAVQNAQHELGQRHLQLGVESQRAGNDLSRRELALGARRDDFMRENALLAALLGGLGGAGMGGILSPLSFSESSTHPYIPGRRG